MVGLTEVSRVAHAMEDVLGELSAARLAPEAELIDTMLTAVDGLTVMTTALLDGDDQSGQADELEQSLRALLETASAPDGDSVPPAREAPVPVPAAPSPARGRIDLHALPLPAETVAVPIDRLDELVRLAGEASAAHLRLERVVTERLGPQAADLAELRELAQALQRLHTRTMHARMVPISTITDKLRRAVRDLARTLEKRVRWEVEGAETELDRAVLERLADPLLHLVRNAVDHGVERAEERLAAGKPVPATVRLTAEQVGAEVILTVADDGRGVDVDEIRREATGRGTDVSGLSQRDLLDIVFAPGFSTAATVSQVSGRGVGLDVVSAEVRALHGRIELHSEPGVGTEFRLSVPITLAVLPCLLVEAGRQRFAVPMHSVVSAQPPQAVDAPHAGGRPVVRSAAEVVALTPLGDLLAEPANPQGGDRRAPGSGRVLVLAGPTRKQAFSVDALLGQRNVIVKALSPLLAGNPLLAGASLEPNGEVLLVLDAGALVESARSAGMAPAPRPAAKAAPVGRSLLVVDDALTVRELQRSILEQAGYRVRTASDGVEALARLAEQPADLVITDIEMPRMDGFGLLQAIRAHRDRRNVAVLIVTSRDNEADRSRSFEMGADGYVVKSRFDGRALVSSVERLLGKPG